MTNSSRHRQTRNAARIVRWLIAHKIGTGEPLTPTGASSVARDAFVPDLAAMREEGIAWHLVAEWMNKRRPTVAAVKTYYRGRYHAAHPSDGPGSFPPPDCVCQLREALGLEVA